MSQIGFKARMRVGYVVFGTLIATKIVEYFIAMRITKGSWPYLAVLALAGAWLIYYYFMHIRHLWRRESKSDE